MTVLLPVTVVRRLAEIARKAGVSQTIDVVGPFDHDAVTMAEEQVAKIIAKTQEASHG